MTELMTTIAEALTKRGFHVYHAATAEEAGNLALSMVNEGESVGIGGSMTVKELGLAEQLQQRGHPVFWHWLVQPSERPQVLEAARQADVYFASANAVTKDGRLVNIDGTANRVSSMAFGPKKVILVVSEKKLVDGGVSAAVARIKRETCPKNAIRLKLDTPCGHTGRCNPAECGNDSMCAVTMVMDHPTHGRDVTIILTDAALGY